MQKTLTALSLAAGIGIVCCQNATAVPGSGTGVNQAAIAASPLQQAQFAGHHARHGVVKCYREFVVGPYHCHHFWNW
jgi:hypothetical protein